MAPVAMIGLMAAGGAIGIAGNIMKANAQKQADEYNAQLMDRQAELAEQQGAVELQRQVLTDKMGMGSIRAAYGASGVTGDGSAQDVLEMNASIAKLNENTIRNNTINQAATYRAQAGQYQKQAGTDFIAGILGASAAGAEAGGNILRRVA